MNKNKLKIVFVAAALTVVGAAGCRKESLLYPGSKTSVDSQNAFASAGRIEGQVNGFYNALKHGQFYGGRYLVYNDIRGENFINETANGVTGYQTWQHTLSNGTDEVQNVWSRAYLAINDANLFMDGMNNGGTEVVGEAKANEYIGEALFIRALSYYSLLQLYAKPYTADNGASPGVPLRLTGNAGAGDYGLARSSVAEVYTQILEDLTTAEANLPDNYGDPLLNTTRAHKNTAIALKVRVLLTMGDYAGVVTEANKIVSSAAPFTAPSGVSMSLASDVASIFVPPYLSDESIFSLPMTANSAPGTQNALQYYYVGNEEYTLNPDGIIGNAGWQDNDARRGLIVDGVAGPVVNKFAVPSPWTDYVPVIRYAEVLLSLGEAITRSTNSVDARAVALLNAVRNRSDATTTFSTSDFASADALAEAFVTERNIEFLGEGLRSIDIQRLGLPYSARGGVPAVAPGEPAYTWPIAADELLYNPLMEDN